MAPVKNICIQQKSADTQFVKTKSLPHNMPLSNLIYIILVLQHGMESAGFVEEIVRGKFHFFVKSVAEMLMWGPEGL